jgi:hypothetical protein
MPAIPQVTLPLLLLLLLHRLLPYQAVEMTPQLPAAAAAAGALEYQPSQLPVPYQQALPNAAAAAAVRGALQPHTASEG